MGQHLCSLLSNMAYLGIADLDRNSASGVLQALEESTWMQMEVPEPEALLMLRAVARSRPVAKVVMNSIVRVWLLTVMARTALWHALSAVKSRTACGGAHK